MRRSPWSTGTSSRRQLTIRHAPGYAIFVGRKGVGKSANLLKLVSEIGKDKRNLVCVIKPVAYDLEGIVSLLGKYKERDVKGYAV